ncbi:MAG: SUMF1/EgtB/PvdO family nonheme iron enzyme [Akkermansiaceae bacterium]|nr:SUMF1/EgtB/PvdO family nonheme iron enzyme [Akkermansiaceae bacterium]
MKLVLDIKIDYPVKQNLPIFTCAIVAAFITSASATVTMDWVSIGNANNAADTADGDSNTFGTQRYGAVDHAYKIGKYEVTNAQYVEFLNAKGQSNTNDIYNTNMLYHGITQSGVSGNFSYSVTSTLANRPVVYVAWFDAARFANWMMNGQGSASMETGAYTLNNATSGIITANIGAQVYIPSENEWYKAAYYNAANASYSLYPNGQNTISTADANYDSSVVGSTTNVGTYSDAPSSYGTNDQGGNVSEWNDAVIKGTSRGLRGGAWNDFGGGYNLRASSRYIGNDPWTELSSIGFRVAAVPEPTSILLSMLASGIMLIRRKR